MLVALIVTSALNYGCDVGSRRLAIACPETGHVATIRLPRSKSTPTNPAADVRQLGEWIAATVPPTSTLWVEAPIAGSSGNRLTAIRMGMAVGATCASHAGPSHLVFPMTWKKAVIGHGHAGKDDVRAWVAERHPALAAACQDDQDLFDATCLGLYGGLADRPDLADVG